ncbi:Proton-coupled amino acid transporter 4 [Penaeus vannamei]|uniref:Proton-coupled amino acid transporter 4 n=1 Tax=Penaeus vannamei TaxID=6689 RepID=A0A3R7NAU0_PENVA|nr:Proton-coupled amino acid transporter 4 [Penaeus vannamei]
MEVTGQDISFSLQHGLVRDTTTVNASQLTLKTLKDRACDFINSKVGRRCSLGGAATAVGSRKVRTLLVAAIVLMGVLVPDFGKILNLIGGSSVTIESFVLPPLCYLKLCRAKDDHGKPFRSVGIVESSVLVVVIGIGVCAGVITTYTAAAAIATPGALGKTCFFS